ncbi:MAG: DEAD/DEAH box helicase family protein [Thermodesulfobacteriota bacterium]|jgi:type III restriction enzyme
MKKATIDELIKNSPYEEPKYFWSYDRVTRLFELKDGRRPAGYVIASESSKAFDDPGIFVEIPLVNLIRDRVKAWKNKPGHPYSGVTGITRQLLSHWNNPEERDSNRRLFFCQLEAMETLIWLLEAPDSEKVGIEIPSDGGPLNRICSKMATGGGKTIVMAMLIAWQVLNKVTYPQDSRFSKHIFVVAPGLTVKNRLQVLIPSSEGNYYDEFSLIPIGLKDKLRQGKVRVRNWHTLHWESEEKLAKKKSVDKRGVKSNEAYVREVLGDMANASNLVVINDEAHHAWRIPAESKVKGIKKDELEEATIWVNGLDRIHTARNILACYDFSATPFAPSGKKSSEEALFGWIVSDFGLNDAIESGLVKTPRVVIRDDGVPDAKTYKSKLYHLYNDSEVKDDLNRKAEDYETLPDLVINAYYLLGKDWLETKLSWGKTGFKTPPVMISVANRTETAARIKYAFDHKKIRIDELCIPEQILHIDSKVLELAESQEEMNLPDEPNEEEEIQDEPIKKLSKKDLAERLRQTVGTVGQVGKPGEQIQKVISVGMLSEGWDAKTVTHIMGLRAFSSQLLCEQVVGRGLRRTSYEVQSDTGLFEPEYVNIFGVPFTFLPHEGTEGPPPPPPPPKTKIEPIIEKQSFEISWPNIIRIDHVYKPKLCLDMGKVKPLEIDASKTVKLAELAPVIEGKPDLTRISEIDLEELGKTFRMQKVIFETARDIFDQMQPTWKGNKEFLLAQLFRLVEDFLSSDRITIEPPLFYQDDFRRRILLTLNMNKVVQHIWEAIRFENTETIEPVFDRDRPIRSTGGMPTWYTGKPCEYTKKSHINYCVFDSTWEASEAFELDHNPKVEAWAKNDHLGFEVLYIFEGVVHKYRPDFIIRLKKDCFLVLETKGQDSQKDKTKREFLNEWVKAVNGHGGFGKWAWAVSKKPGELKGILNVNLLKEEI